MRDPIAKVLQAGLCAALVLIGARDIAIFVETAFETYIRFTAVRHLALGNILPPVAFAGNRLGHWAVKLPGQDEGAPSKTGSFDDTVMLDLPVQSHIGPLLTKMGTENGGPIFLFSPAQARSAWEKASSLAKLDHLGMGFHNLRHGGPSRDALEKFRSLEEIQKRGKWGSFRSVCRYEKHGRLHQTLSKVDPKVLKWCALCERRLPEILEGSWTPPFP